MDSASLHAYNGLLRQLGLDQKDSGGKTEILGSDAGGAQSVAGLAPPAPPHWPHREWR